MSGASGTALVWLRRDLRLHDNPALRHAAAHHERVVPVYIHAPDELDPWRPGAAARWWQHQALAALATDLRKRHSRLILRAGPSLQALRELAADCGAEAVYWNRLYEPATIARDKAVRQALDDDGLTVRSFNAALLWEPWQVETGDGGPYRVFTPFWKACRGRDVEPPADAPKPLPGLPDRPDSLALDDLGLMPASRWYDGLAGTWTVSEDAAHERLAAVCETVLDDYAKTRDLPGVDGVSRLSPYLHHGLLSPRQVWHAVAGHCEGRPLDFKSPATFLSELAWREFSHHALYHFPRSCERPVQQKFKDYPWYDGKYRDRRLRAWQRGRTGVPLVDAGMRQLWQTGWMHNRVRMVAASYLTKNLRIHWLDGARWFWDTLVDADLANNSMGWQWTAGSGFDAAPYFRVFNPARQGQQYDPDGDYVRRWVPELAELPDNKLHCPWELDADRRPPERTYPAPLVDLRESRERALAGYRKIK